MPFVGFSNLLNAGNKIGRTTLKNVIRTGENSLNVIYQGIVKAKVLNIRSAPSLHGERIGKYTKGTMISILEKTANNWYRFKYNNRDAYVSADFVNLLKGKINTAVLNVRKSASLNDEVIGQLKRYEVVTIAHVENNKWYKIHFNEGFGYVYSKYVRLLYQTENNNGTVTNTKEFLKNNKVLLNTKVAPDKLIDEPLYPRAKRLSARTYNNFGGLTKVISKQLQIAPAAAIAILAVESAGNAYGSQGKVLIRFENHLFWRFWGKKNKSKYKEHFRFDKRKYWTNHLFRKSKDDNWTSFHGNQEKEWEVFEFARQLSPTAAYISTSYGAPQILGTNYKKIGYKSPDDLLQHFQKDVRFHVLGLFDFFSPQMIKYIQRKDFTSFAGYYNGSGQAIRYGLYIREFYNAYKSLKIPN